MHAEDETLMVGVFIKEKENGKEEKSSTAKKVGHRNIFAKGVSWGS